MTARLVTPVGTGGSGKTRLAVELGRSMLGRYPDGVWFIDLASLTAPEQVRLAVLATLGSADQPAADLAEVLGERRLLLVLDNCEHPIDACASLATDLLSGCRHAQILATSREALRIAGEVAWQVPALAIPDQAAVLDLERLSHNDAVRLFVARVRAIQHDFVLTPANAAAVVDMCRHVDGLPLALELAAARVPALGVSSLAHRLEHALQVLSSGSRAAPPRQQTLRATLDWSHALIDEPERCLFRRLAVFMNGWTLDAAEGLTAHTTAATLRKHHPVVPVFVPTLSINRLQRAHDTAGVILSKGLPADENTSSVMHPPSRPQADQRRDRVHVERYKHPAVDSGRDQNVVIGGRA